ncbi:unnamed protein product [Acanthoscelides obtectus]|uniref:Large ribosomal subunit protein P2 n=1 Tax=Acanthoscelides obtectus TaxID=200917 RepID=A0A9P0MGD6_ACAOB|nr:unnamed protein product [Acanthoscelides obtectus]CAK1682516.1 60S acidic ribosomal protein P2 [Acanthoscelides obtectus]
MIAICGSIFHALYLSLKDVFRVSFAFRVKRLKKMRYVAAYLLAVLGGKASPSSADIEKILGSVGVEADGERLKKVISELNGKSIDDLIAQGKLGVRLGEAANKSHVIIHVLSKF